MVEALQNKNITIGIKYSYKYMSIYRHLYNGGYYYFFINSRLRLFLSV